MNELKIYIGLHRTLNHIDKMCNKLFAEYNLTMSQFAVLEALYHKGELSIGEVQEKILSSCGTMPLIVRNLEKRDLIIKRTDPSDKRKTLLSLTENGRLLITEVYPKNEEIIVNMMKIWTEDEKSDLATLFKKYGGIIQHRE